MKFQLFFLVLFVAICMAIGNPIDTTGKPEHCLLMPKKNGNGFIACMAYIPSYSYNPDTDKCEFFIYGGCLGNENRFEDPENCVKVCGASGYVKN